MTPEKTPTAIEITTKALLHLKEGRPEEAKQILEEMVGLDVPAPSIILLKDFELAFRTACKKHQVHSGAYIIFQAVGGEEKVRMTTGGHSRAMATLDEMIRNAILFQRAVRTTPGSGPGSLTPPAFAATKGGNA